MKQPRLVFVGLPLCVGWLALLLNAFTPLSVTRAQTAPAPPKYAMLEFIKYEPGKAAEYRKVEQEVWQPIHRERVKAGVIRSWSLWNRTLPGGAAYDYDALIVTTFNDFANVGTPYPAGIALKAHPTLKPEQITEATGARTVATRRMVKTELVSILDSTNWPALTQEMPRFLLVGYMQPTYGMTNKYVTLERNAWKPVHQERVNQGILRLWILLGANIPTGTDRSYSHMTFEAYDKFAHLENRYPASVLDKAAPVEKRDEIGAQTTASRKQVRTELYTLVDAVR
jgi:hypothetical protein